MLDGRVKGFRLLVYLVCLFADAEFEVSNKLVRYYTIYQ